MRILEAEGGDAPIDASVKVRTPRSGDRFFSFRARRAPCSLCILTHTLEGSYKISVQ